MRCNLRVFLRSILVNACVMTLSLTPGHAIFGGGFFKKEKTCQEGALREPPCKKKVYQKLSVQNKPSNSSSFDKALSKEKDLIKLQAESVRQVDELLKNEEFQDLISDLNSKIPDPSKILPPSQKSNLGDLYIFVSFSLGEKALENLAREAWKYGATLVLRGFIGGSHQKTVKALQKIITTTGQGFIIDPELFDLFSVTAVPTYILAKPFSLTATERTQTPLHDRLQGHVSIRYALETFANPREGDPRVQGPRAFPGPRLNRGDWGASFSEVAKALLLKGSNLVRSDLIRSGSIPLNDSRDERSKDKTR